MTKDSRFESQNLSLSALRRIESICARFESDAENGCRTEIDTLLGSAEGEERNELLRELLILDIELCEKRGDNPNPSDTPIWQRPPIK